MIWPSVFGDDYEFSVTIQLPDKDNAESETKYNSYNFTLDSDQKPVNVAEGVGLIVLVNLGGRNLSRDDPAKQTILHGIHSFILLDG